MVARLGCDALSSVPSDDSLSWFCLQSYELIIDKKKKPCKSLAVFAKTIKQNVT